MPVETPRSGNTQVKVNDFTLITSRHFNFDDEFSLVGIILVWSPQTVGKNRSNSTRSLPQMKDYPSLSDFDRSVPGLVV